MTIKIIKGTSPQWWAAWIGYEFDVPKSWPHTKTHWCIDELPTGENGEGPEGYMMAPKEDCEIINK